MKTRILSALFVILLFSARPSQAGLMSDEWAQAPHDFSYVVTTPFRLSSYSWYCVPAAGALAVTMAYDGVLHDRLVNLREWGGADSLRQAGSVLQFSGVILGAGFMAYGKSADDNRLLDNGWVELEGAATAGTIGIAAKWVIGRGRPDTGDPDYFSAFSGNSSFPSGHTTMAFTAAQITAEEYPSWWVRIPGYLAATAVGVSRIASDDHWVGDVLAGAMLGAGVGHVIVKVHRRDTKDWHLLASGSGMTLAYDF